MSDRAYVLGTYDEEITRLGLQHRVWRAHVTDCWNRAGITIGQRVLDVGAGPGFATNDLAQIVGETGSVTALELSKRFVEIGRLRASHDGLNHVDYHECDLVTDTIQGRNYDAAWCRWVLSFVTNPALVVKKVFDALKPGGVYMIHEYLEYSTWGFLPPRPEQHAFCLRTMKNWRDAGGEPNIGLALPRLLRDAGFRIKQAKPIMFTIKPGDYAWQWPLAWVSSSGKRLVETGEMTQVEADRLAEEFRFAGEDPETLMLSPSVIEIIAERSAKA